MSNGVVATAFLALGVLGVVISTIEARRERRAAANELPDRIAAKWRGLNLWVAVTRRRGLISELGAAREREGELIARVIVHTRSEGGIPAHLELMGNDEHGAVPLRAAEYAVEAYARDKQGTFTKSASRGPA